jgi:hypothetical protein
MIAGRILVSATSGTATDDRIVGNVGMGGQGVLAIPVVYNGWVQKLPQFWKDQLTPDQLNPIPERDASVRKIGGGFVTSTGARYL